MFRDQLASLSFFTLAIASGSAFAQEREAQFSPVIMPSYDPSIGAGIGLIPLYAFYPNENDLVSDASSIAFPLIYSNNGSYIAKVGGDLILDEDSLRIQFNGGLAMTNINMVGIDTARTNWNLEGDVLFKVADNLFTGVGVNYMTSKYEADDASLQPLLETAGFYEDFTDDVGLRVVVQWDTREQYYFPHSGAYLNAYYETHASWLGNEGDQSYASLFNDFRYFHSLNGDPNHIIASRVSLRYLFDSENAPSSAFATYGRQGKEVQRGFVMGDYISANMFNVELEYRYSFHDTEYDWVNRSKLHVILGSGRSFGTQLDRSKLSFSDAEALTIVGLGYRFVLMPAERINLKVDLTYNDEGEWIGYFGVMETI